MKRSDFYMRVITVVLFLAVASYIGVYLFNASISTYVTAPAISYTVEHTLATQGYIVRTETVLTDVSAAVLPIVGDGDKVAAGQAIAYEYTNREALEAASEIRALKLRIAQLESTSASASESSKVESVSELSKALRNGDLGKLDELTLVIETHVFSSSSSETELPVLQTQLQTLESRIEGIRTLYAPVSGTFSQVIDGFEHVAPSSLTDVLPTGLIGLFASRSGAFGVGKLVTEFKWFFAAIMASEDASRISAGQSIPVHFSGAYNAVLEMKVERVGKLEEGNCVVLFSCDRSIHEVTPLRYLRANIVTGVVSGIRVPKEAIHLDDDATTFIYLQSGARAERVNVEILHEVGDVYLVRDGIETGSPLREGSTIIVKANNLYHGKIVV